MSTRVGFVVTEHPSRLDDEARATYDAAALTLAEIFDREIVTSHYLDPDLDVSALVLSGSWSPWTTHDPAALDRLGELVCAYPGPVFGICGGMQLLARFAGGRIEHCDGNDREIGFLPLQIVASGGLFDDVSETCAVRQWHTDEIVELPAEFELLASTDHCRVQAIASRTRPWWGTQFHPELFDAEHPDGELILRSFAARAQAAAAVVPGAGAASS